LGEGVAVSRVEIYNRLENSDRLSYSTVYLINYQGTAVKTWIIGDATYVPVFYCDFLQPPIGTPDTTTTTPRMPETGAWTILEQIASVVGVASALVGAAFACAKWKRKMNSTSTSAIQTNVARSTNMTSSTLTASATVPQSTNVYNTPMPSSQPNPTQGQRRSSLGLYRSSSSRI